MAIAGEQVEDLVLLAWGEQVGSGVEHTAGLGQGICGALASMVKFLPGAPAALIESITGKAHDVEGIHDRGCVWEFFSGGAFEPGESIHRDDLDALAPGVGLGGQPGFEDPLGSAGTMSKSREGPRRSRMGVRSKMTVTILVAVGGVSPYVFIHANDTHAFKPGWIVDQ